MAKKKNPGRSYSLETILLTTIEQTVKDKFLLVGRMAKPRRCVRVETCQVYDDTTDFDDTIEHTAFKFFFEDGKEIIEQVMEIDDRFVIAEMSNVL